VNSFRSEEERIQRTVESEKVKEHNFLGTMQSGNIWAISRRRRTEQGRKKKTGIIIRLSMSWKGNANFVGVTWAAQLFVILIQPFIWFTVTFLRRITVRYGNAHGILTIFISSR
jgi:hypothetical protein